MRACFPIPRWVPPHVVREIVGHPDIGVTMQIYAHASLDERRRAMDAWMLR